MLLVSPTIAVPVALVVDVVTNGDSKTSNVDDSVRETRPAAVQLGFEPVDLESRSFSPSIDELITPRSPPSLG